MWKSVLVFLKLVLFAVLVIPTWLLMMITSAFIGELDYTPIDKLKKYLYE